VCCGNDTIVTIVVAVAMVAMVTIDELVTVKEG
jgi:hypothetical protein